jgi:hypothetical protein
VGKAPDPPPPPDPSPIDEGILRNEWNAIAALKTISTAEADFRANDRDGNRVHDFWTMDISGLYRFENTLYLGQIKLIEHAVACADAAPAGSLPGMGPLLPSKPFHGYWFKMLPVASSANGRSLTEFAATAWPAEYGVSGRRTFVVNQLNTILAKELDGVAASVWPTQSEARFWERDVDPVNRFPSGTIPKDISEIGRAQAARHGFASQGLETRRFVDPKSHDLVSFPELLGLEGTRWTEFSIVHDEMLERARLLERQRAQIRIEGEKTIIEIAPFPEDGKAVVAEWRRYLQSTLTPEQLTFCERHQFMLFPQGLGEYPVTITLERVGDLIVGEERIELSKGKEVLGAPLGEPGGQCPRSCLHLVR